MGAVTGNQPSRTPKMSWAKLPITKTGIEMTSSVLTVTRLSANFPRRIPASIPAEMPITISMMIAITAELECGRQANGEFVSHRVPEERLAQITLKHIAHVEEVLDHQRLVQVVLLPEAAT